MKRRDNTSCLFLLVTFAVMFSILNPTFLTSFENQVNPKMSPENNVLEVKIHKPGDYFHDEQKLIWSPNDLPENRVMQISVYADGLFDTSSIRSLSIDGVYKGEIVDILRFEINSTDFAVESTETGTIISVDYSYDTETWSGNYTINATLLLNDGREITGTFTGLNFLEFDYRISSPATDNEIYMCKCEPIPFNLTIQNLGSSERNLVLDIRVETESSKQVDVSLDQSSGKNTSIIGIDLYGSESYQINLTLSPSSLFNDSEISKISPIYLEIYYETDEGDYVYLHQDWHRYIIIPLKDDVAPEILVSSNQFDYEEIYQQYLSSIDYNDTIFTLGYNWLTFDYQVRNSGYYSRHISLNSTTNLLDVKVIIGEQNLSLIEFNQLNYTIGQNGFLNFELFIGFDPFIEDELLITEVGFDKELITTTGLRISNVPQTYTPILNISDQNIYFESGEETQILSIEIDISAFNNLNYFTNNWSMYCANPSEVRIVILELSILCNENILVDLIESRKTYTLQLEVLVWGDNNVIELPFIVYHTQMGRSSTLSQMVNITLDRNESIDIGTNQSNNDNSNSSNDDTNEENNQTDIDNDGIVDSLDKCLDTKVGDTVDEFGCTITDTGIDDDQQNNPEQQQKSDNPASKSNETNVLLYAVVGLIIVAILGGVLVIRNRSSAKSNNSATSTVANPVMPLPVMPLAPLEPVVLQQWTDANGYSWRQMSDQTIMWWNGTDWIPYGKN